MNRTEARDFIFDFAKDAWDVAAAAVVTDGTPIAFRYQGVTQGPDAGEPAQGTFWARVSIQTVDEYQETLRNGTVRRFVTVGLVFVQILAPNTHGEAQAWSDKLAELVRNTFRERCVDDNLEFTGVAIDDNVRREPAWLPVNINGRFAYRQFI